MHATDVCHADAATAVNCLKPIADAAYTASPVAVAPMKTVSRFNQFLSSIATLPPEADFLTAAAESMAHLIGARFLALSLYDPTADTLTCQAIVTPPEDETLLRMHLEPWPLGVTMAVPSDATHQALLCGELQDIGRNDHGLDFGQPPAEVCVRAKQMPGIAACYAVGMVWRNAIVGCILFGMAEAGIVAADLVEACAHQVAALFQQRATEQMLSEANAQLEARVRDRTAQLEAANRALQASEEQLRRLNADLAAYDRSVSHDLRNALGFLLMSSELLMEFGQELSASDLALLAQQMNGTAQRGLNVIDSLLWLAQPDDLPLTLLDMNQLVDDVCAMLRLLNQEQAPTITRVTALPPALGHAGLVERIWDNLITNAIKYSHSPAQIEIGGELWRDKMVRYWVRDYGDGIPLDAQPHLFDPFFRLADATIRGHGLGLPLVKRILTQLGGVVSVESSGKPGEGARLYFTLPRS